MVQPVMAVSSAGRIRRDQRKHYHLDPECKKSNDDFAEILENAKKELPKASLDCYTTTYSRDCRIRTFLYQSGEYHY